MTNPAPQTPPTDQGPVDPLVRYTPSDKREGDRWVTVVRWLEQRGTPQEWLPGVRLPGVWFEIIDAGGETPVFAHESELEYPPYELPDWQAQPLTLRQWLKLASLCARYRVPFDPTHYRVYSMESSMTKGFAEGWLGGQHGDGRNPSSRQTLYVGVAPDGSAHS